jgi:DNA-directed RNA polymerase specialized sigma24 family protein
MNNEEHHYRRRRTVPLADLPTESILAVVDDGFHTESAEIARMIQWGLARLPRHQAGLLEAFHLEQHSVARIAQDLRLSERAVEGRLRRARITLRRQIERLIGNKGE